MHWSHGSGALWLPAYQSTVPAAGPVVTGISSVDVHHHGTGPPDVSALGSRLEVRTRGHGHGGHSNHGQPAPDGHEDLLFSQPPRREAHS